ncbi:MAG: hypothetical protein ABIJ08_07570 [Nanoarchaeota archaeon]
MVNNKSILILAISIIIISIVYADSSILGAGADFIDFPVSGNYYDKSITQLNWSALDYNLTSISKCWYDAGSGFVLFNCSNKSLTSVLSKEGQNDWSIKIQKNATPDIQIDQNTFYVDTLSPGINIDDPKDKNYSAKITMINFTIEEANMGNINDCVFSDETANTTFNCVNGSNSFAFISVEGNNTWTITATDQAGRSNSSSVSFFVDSVFPLVQFVNPTTAQGTYSQTWIDVNVTAYDLYLDSIIVYLYNPNGLVNSTTVQADNLDLKFLNLSDERYYINASANDTLGHVNYTETRMILLDTTPPIVGLIGPNAWENGTYVNFTFNVSDNFDTNISCSLYTDASGNFSLNQTIFVMNNSENKFTLELQDGNYTWNVECSDGVNSAFAAANISFNVDTKVLTPLFYPNITITTSSYILVINFSEYVVINSALFNNNSINLSSLDNMSFSYSASGLTNGVYELIVNASDYFNHTAVFGNNYTVAIPAVGGGGGGGGGSGGSKCTPDWECDVWSDCSSGKQTRSCTDKNGCSDASTMPKETMSCAYTKDDSFQKTEKYDDENDGNGGGLNWTEEDDGSGDGDSGSGVPEITGAVVGGFFDSVWKIIIPLLVLIIAIVVSYFVFKKRNNKEETEDVEEVKDNEELIDDFSKD